MNDKNDYLLDRLDYLEFRQSLLFLKPPQHKAHFFYELTLEDFLSIKSYVNYYSDKIKNGENISLNDFSKGLTDIWPPAKSYPPAASLIAECLMKKDLFKKLIP